MLLAITLLLSLIISFSFTYNAKANTGDIDYIENYDVYVDPNRKDGSLHMKYDITWRVIDSSSEGPLEWVKIGIPNKYIENLKTSTEGVVKKIEYYSDSGSYIRIDFKTKYRSGNTVRFIFEFDISRMYLIHENDIFYNFRTGYFDSINIGKHRLYWNKNGLVGDFTCSYETEDYYVIERNDLYHGDRIECNAKYDRSYFDYIDDKLTYSDKYMTLGDYLGIFFVIFVIVLFIVIAFIAIRKSRDPYMYNRGFVGYHYYPYFYHHHHYYSNGYDRSGNKINPPSSTGAGGSSGGFSSGGCACACACACAGGGRAGCSKKDFYNTTINVEDIK